MPQGATRHPELATLYQRLQHPVLQVTEEMVVDTSCMCDEADPYNHVPFHLQVCNGCLCQVTFSCLKVGVRCDLILRHKRNKLSGGSVTLSAVTLLVHSMHT